MKKILAFLFVAVFMATHGAGVLQHSAFHSSTVQILGGDPDSGSDGL